MDAESKAEASDRVASIQTCHLVDNQQPGMWWETFVSGKLTLEVVYNIMLLRKSPNDVDLLGSNSTMGVRSGVHNTGT